MVRAGLILLAFLLAGAGPAPWATVHTDTVTVHDADTVHVGHWVVRLARIQAPEVVGVCEAEAKLGIEARDFVKAWFTAAPTVRVQWARMKSGAVKLDKYRRRLAEFRRGKENLSDLLVSKGYAKPWGGTGVKPSWC